MNQTIYVPATKAQHTLSKIFELVERGDKVIFTKYGREIGQLTAVEKKESKKDKLQDIFRFIDDNAIDLGYTTDITKEIREMRDAE